MTTKRLLTFAGAVVLLLAGCGDSSDDGQDSADTPTAATETAAAGPDTAAVTSNDWAEQLVVAFGIYDAARTELDRRVGQDMGEIAEPTEQDFYDVLANQMMGWADAGDELTAALPADVPADLEPTFQSVLDAHLDLVVALRNAGTALRSGDPEPYNELEDGARTAFEVACADLQFAVVDLGEGLIACGIPDEDPDVRIFEERSTVDDTDEFVDMPAGSYQLDYVGPAGSDPFVTIGLDYDDDLVIRTSVEIVELARATDGPAIRIHANELTANPTRLESTEIPDFWPLSTDPTGWIEALEGVTVVSTGDGAISGIEARYWDLVSERDAPVAVLGDGVDWVPETVLRPGEPVRLWSLAIDGRPLLVTQHAPAGSGPDAFTDDFDFLLGGLTLTPR